MRSNTDQSESWRVKSQEYQSLESELLKMIREYKDGCSESQQKAATKTKTDVQSEENPPYLYLGRLGGITLCHLPLTMNFFNFF